VARELGRGPERAILPDRWAFATCDRDASTGQVDHVSPNPQSICLFDGFDPTQLYELTYTARDPRVSGIGFAATRDFISFLRHADADADGTPNPIAGQISTVICSGGSQAGHYLRSYIYQGFNEDTAGRKTCDGTIVITGAAQKSELNSRFPNPEHSTAWSRGGIYPRVIFPFSYGVTTDPITGRTDGILKRPASDPLVMQIDTENEYWQSNASLVGHDGLGHPLSLPENARYYVMAGAQHTSGTPSAMSICQQPTNPMSYAVFTRALLVALDEWVRDGTPPPPSRYPRADDATLVAVDQATGFPAIPGVTFLPYPTPAAARDYGPSFGPAGGIPTMMPGVVLPGKEYRVLVPTTDSDGHDVAGLRRPDEVEVPLATHTGWNTRRAGFREGELCGLNGMLVPLARTQSERLETGDPRPSIEERYPTHADYVARIEAAATALHDQRYLLDEDVQAMLRAASERDVP
jgi:hypothetical protein